MKKLIILSNDKLYFKNKTVYSDYNDTINIIQALSKKNDIFFLSRMSKKKGAFKTKINNQNKLGIFDIKSLNLQNANILMISITPLNFISFFLLKYFHKGLKGYVILRSDGHKEYSTKIKFLGDKIYQFFFKQILKQLKPIVVTDKLTNIKSYKYLKIYPSEINSVWEKKIKKTDISKPKLFYLGRLKKEKGIFSLLKLVQNFDFDFDLQIVGSKKKIISKNKNVKIGLETSNINKLINYFDNSNIFILPSYTEGAPKVILESLSRLRPIIIFQDISHVKKNMKGIFVCKRNTKSLQTTIMYIIKNYKKIQSEMKKNSIPTKYEFQNKIEKIIK